MANPKTSPTVRVHHDNATGPQPPAAAPAIATNAIVTDARGRTITIIKLGALQKMRLLKAVGPVNSKNDQYMGYAALAASVTAIDGMPEGFPGSEAQIEAIVGRLDQDGLDAVAEGYTAYGWVKEEEAADPAKVKNS
jgi:hypothetical protein